MSANDDEHLRKILGQIKTIAVVGIKDAENEDAFRVPRTLQARGYRILPVNPKLDHVLGEPAVATLADIQEFVDCVSLFRASDHIPGHVDEILAMSPRPMVIWMQLGIHHGLAAARLRAEGIEVVQDRCIMVEDGRLMRRDVAV